MKLTDEAITLAWHDVSCARGAFCPRRGAHAREHDGKVSRLRRFVECLLAVPEEATNAELALAEHRLHLMRHIAKADDSPAVAAALEALGSLLKVKRRGQLRGDALAARAIAADEYAATLLGHRDHHALPHTDGAVRREAAEEDR